MIELHTIKPHISIHAPREGSDIAGQAAAAVLRISIHAPREGSDPCGSGSLLHLPHFNPRSP